MRILIALDGNAESEATLAPAERLVRATGGDALLLSVMDPYIDVANVVADSRHEAMISVVAERRAYLERCAQQLDGLPVTILPEVLERGEDVPSAIVRVCREQQADMIVVASKQASGLRGLLLGSTAQQVLRLAPCPVLVVRSGESGQ